MFQGGLFHIALKLPHWACLAPVPAPVPVPLLKPPCVSPLLSPLPTIGPCLCRLAGQRLVLSRLTHSPETHTKQRERQLIHVQVATLQSWLVPVFARVQSDVGKRLLQPLPLALFSRWRKTCFENEPR